MCVYGAGGGWTLFEHKVSFLFSGLYFPNSMEVISLFKKLASPETLIAVHLTMRLQDAVRSKEGSDSERDFRIETCHSKVPENGKMDR